MIRAIWPPGTIWILWCRQGKLAEAQRLWEETEGAALAKTRMNQALAFLGMSGPAYADLEEPGPGRPLAALSQISGRAGMPQPWRRRPRQQPWPRPLPLLRPKMDPGGG